MIITITGTPGTGKTYIAKKLAGKNLIYIDLNKIIKEEKLYDKYDRKVKTYDVNIKTLEKLESVYEEFKDKPIKAKKVSKKAVKPMKVAVKEVLVDKPRDIHVVNIVVSTSLEHDIPLEKMAATLSNTEYNPEQFPGLVIRIREPKTSALIFSSGKVVCTGARSMEKVEESIKKIIKNLEKINVKITIKPKINIQNIVASGSVGMDLNLNMLAMKLENTEYEPEQFPGLVYKLPQAKATFLLFSNGKIVCTGTKSEKEVNEAVDKLVENLKNLKKR